MTHICPVCGSDALEYLPNMQIKCCECLLIWEDQEDEETAGDRKYHELKEEDKLDRFGNRKDEDEDEMAYHAVEEEGLLVRKWGRKKD